MAEKHLPLKPTAGELVEFARPIAVDAARHMSYRFGSKIDTEDIVQEVLLVLLKRFEEGKLQLANYDSFKAFIKVCIANRMVDYMRRNSAIENVEAELVEALQVVDANAMLKVEEAISTNTFDQILNLLEPELRSFAIDAIRKELSIDALSEKYRITRDSVMVKKSRLVDTIRREVKRSGKFRL